MIFLRILEWAKGDHRIHSCPAHCKQPVWTPDNSKPNKASFAVGRNTGKSTIASSVDLLKEYDLGIEKIKGWNVGDVVG